MRPQLPACWVVSGHLTGEAWGDGDRLFGQQQIKPFWPKDNPVLLFGEDLFPVVLDAVHPGLCHIEHERVFFGPVADPTMLPAAHVQAQEKAVPGRKLGLIGGPAPDVEQWLVAVRLPQLLVSEARAPCHQA